MLATSAHGIPPGPRWKARPPWPEEARTASNTSWAARGLHPHRSQWLETRPTVGSLGLGHRLPCKPALLGPCLRRRWATARLHRIPCQCIVNPEPLPFPSSSQPHPWPNEPMKRGRNCTSATIRRAWTRSRMAGTKRPPTPSRTGVRHRGRGRQRPPGQAWHRGPKGQRRWHPAPP
jgi:hypothetical protein